VRIDFPIGDSPSRQARRIGLGYGDFGVIARHRALTRSRTRLRTRVGLASHAAPREKEAFPRARVEASRRMLTLSRECRTVRSYWYSSTGLHVVCFLKACIIARIPRRFAKDAAGAGSGVIRWFHALQMLKATLATLDRPRSRPPVAERFLKERSLFRHGGRHRRDIIAPGNRA